jgi:superfamily II DNA or RNA helicase
MSYSDSDSDSGGAPVHAPNEIDVETPIEPVENLTGEDDLLSDSQSVASLHFSDDTPIVKPRSYQTEMFEESLKHNIIIAADTGSGKTHM